LNRRDAELKSRAWAALAAMSVRLYLVNPRSDFPTYFSAEVLAGSGLRPGAVMADLALPTLAAMAPPDFDVRLCDENAAAIDFDGAADCVGITGKINQRQRMIAVAREFRRRGRTVIIGGPCASLSPESLRGECDALVRGEIEDIHETLFADLRRRRLRAEYVGDRPDLARSPVPRWDLYANGQALLGALQTSRGCPFECEFCDVIQYLGRTQRHKPIAAVLAELDALYRAGYRAVFLADDNFTVFRRRAKELLAAIGRWQAGRGMELITQVSIDAARDDELLRMCAAAGISQVFIGIETPSDESLRETRKRQNLRVDLVAETRRFVEHGIAVIGGMIVGFDADGPDIFERQRAFAAATPIPIFTIGALVAPEATPLHERMVREARLRRGGADVQAVPWASNIVPKGMSSGELEAGLRRLCNDVYRPDAFGERMLRFIETMGVRPPPPPPGAGREARSIDADALQVVMNVRKMGPEENKMWYRVWSAASRRPELLPLVGRMLFQYAQLRYMYRMGRYWDPHLAGTPPPGAEATRAVATAEPRR
jgi:radical SAM superfamily enzyme YgiQ (UPF0313 family)